MNHFLELLKVQLANGFVSGGLVLMMTGSIVAMARNLPMRIWARIKDQFVVSVQVTNRDVLFDWLSLWLNDQPYSKRTRRLIATTTSPYSMGQCTPSVVGDGDGEPNRPLLIFSPAAGMHFFVYHGKLLWLSRDDNSGGPQNQNQSNTGRYFSMESYNLRVFGRSQQVIRELLSDVIDLAVAFQKQKISAYIPLYDGWRRLSTFTPRKLDSVILPQELLSSVISDLKEFIDSKSWYVGMGIPYHHGYLFHGLPGSGKTSLIAALAGEFGMNLYILNLAGGEFSDERLAYMINNIQPKSFLVLEDVDTAFAALDRATKDDDGTKKGLTLTGLLNCLDGFMAKDGSIVFMTTNHRDRLDPALIRPGRVDMEVEFREATADQLKRLYMRFFSNATAADAETFAMRREFITMAEAQQYLLRNKPSRTLEAIACGK
jgi:chaperone BCS1